MDNEQPIEARRLPLWKSCLEDMRKSGVQYGTQFTSEFFEERLSCDRNSMQFSLAISEIRRELEYDGFFLSGRGQKQSGFVILQPSENTAMMASYSKAASDALRRGVILGTNTRLDTLSESERRRHEQMLERMAIKSALLQRASSVHKAIIKHAPKVLERDSSKNQDA